MRPAVQMLRYLLLQVRLANDPMRKQEISCFSRSLDCAVSQITVHDLLSGVPSQEQIDAADVVLLGGSGDFSVVEGGPWLAPALAAMKTLVRQAKPTFASCWGFQAMARALGGEVATDIHRAELGTLQLELTEAGEQDPVFGPLGKSFLAQMGHQDLVVRLPPGGVRLASSKLVENQAFRMRNLPIYCTQFHPELNRQGLLERVRAYPQYVERIAGMSLSSFEALHCGETPQTEQLLRRFVAAVVKR